MQPGKLYRSTSPGGKIFVKNFKAQKKRIPKHAKQCESSLHSQRSLGRGVPLHPWNTVRPMYAFGDMKLKRIMDKVKKRCNVAIHKDL